MKKIEINLQQVCSQISPSEYIEHSGANITNLLEHLDPKDVVEYLYDVFGDDFNHTIKNYGFKIERA